MQRLPPVTPCSFLVGMTKFLEPNYTKGIVLSLWRVRTEIVRLVSLKQLKIRIYLPFLLTARGQMYAKQR